VRRPAPSSRRPYDERDSTRGLLVLAASLTIGLAHIANGLYRGVGFLPGDIIAISQAGLWLGAIGLLLFLIEYVRGWPSRDE
jgi:hypothetical protein